VLLLASDKLARGAKAATSQSAIAAGISRASCPSECRDWE